MMRCMSSLRSSVVSVPSAVLLLCLSYSARLRSSRAPESSRESDEAMSPPSSSDVSRPRIHDPSDALFIWVPVTDDRALLLAVSNGWGSLCLGRRLWRRALLRNWLLQMRGAYVPPNASVRSDTLSARRALRSASYPVSLSSAYSAVRVLSRLASR